MSDDWLGRLRYRARASTASTLETSAIHAPPRALEHSAGGEGIERRGSRGCDRVRLVIDTLMAAVALVVLAAPILLLAFLIKLDSPGPAFFRQQRIGKSGRPFEIVKFRTMHVTAPAYSYKVHRHDGRITRIGRFLRRTGLDELPQLWNVVRTEMRLIGPRPELPFIVAQYAPWQHARHQVAPGITGWWQVHHRNDVPMHLNVEFDLYYIRNRSLALDFKIVWLTLRVMLAGLLRKSPATRPLAASADRLTSNR